MLHVQDFRYRLNMILYFDELNGEPGAKDSQVTVLHLQEIRQCANAGDHAIIVEDELVPYRQCGLYR